VQVEVVRSARRRRTVQAWEEDGVLKVAIPAWMSKADEERTVADMCERFERKRSTEGVDLTERATKLARRYRLPEPASIRWVDNQRWRWGSCTPEEGSVRISSRLAGWPGFVLDYVIVHELAHLVEANHGPAFKALVDRYPKAERARGFLMAKGMGEEPAAPKPRARSAEQGDDQRTLW
jgi:hypothetical protein